MSVAGRVALLAAAAAVLALVIVLYLSVRGGLAGDTTPSVASARPVPAAMPTSPTPPLPNSPTGPTPLAPRGVVRPVRIDPPAGLVMPNMVPLPVTGDEPPASTKLAASTLGLMRTTIGPIVRSCAEPLREQNPPLQSHIMVSATLRIASGRIAARDVDVDAPGTGAAFPQCVTLALAALDTVAPPDQNEVEDTIHLVFTVP